MLGTLVTVLLLLVAACAVGVGLSVAPFVLGVDMAERRGFSTTRWGAISIGGIALALLLGLESVKLGLPTVLLLLPAVALAWTGPGVLALLDATQTRLGGTQGTHQH